MTEKQERILYRFLAAPAHAWLWLVAKLLGWEFEEIEIEKEEEY